MIRIFTDASYDEKTKTGGFGLVVCNGQRRDIISNFHQFQSINEAELFAIYMACIMAGGNKAEIITDSQNALSYIRRAIKDKPRTKEQFIRHKHCELLAYKIRKFPNIKFTKIKAHKKVFRRDNINNFLADNLAREGLAKFFERTRGSHN